MRLTRVQYLPQLLRGTFTPQSMKASCETCKTTDSCAWSVKLTTAANLAEFRPVRGVFPRIGTQRPDASMDYEFRDDEHRDGHQNARLRFDVLKKRSLHGAGSGQAVIKSGNHTRRMHLRRSNWLRNSWKTPYVNFRRLSANKVAAEPGRRESMPTTLVGASPPKWGEDVNRPWRQNFIANGPRSENKTRVPSPVTTGRVKRVAIFQQYVGASPRCRRGGGPNRCATDSNTSKSRRCVG